MRTWAIKGRNIAGLLAVVVAIGFAGAVSAEEQPGDPRDAQKDVEAVKLYLAATHPGTRWSDGPTRQKNAAIGTAYPDSRFYYVFTRPMGHSSSNMITAMVRIDKDGTASEVGEGRRVGGEYGPDPQSFNAGLMKVAKAEDAKIAGAAIMSLRMGSHGPYSVATEDVQVTPAGEEKDPKSYTCTATTGRGERGRKVNVFEVRFDADGKCTSASYLPAGASLTELKYQLLLHFPNPVINDPDYYPLARIKGRESFLKDFQELQAHPEEFQTILAHNNIHDTASFTDEQTLLIYGEHKKLSCIYLDPVDDGYRFQLFIRENEVNGFEVKGLIDHNGVIRIQQREPTFMPHPICLAAHTQIDTPGGLVAVETLRVGDAIWTSDATGIRSAAIIIQTGRAHVPPDHQVAHIVLSDKRELWVSLGHPTSDGRRVRDLQIGDLLDGARVTHLNQTTYDQPATYDILPSGGTGFYWANGILIGSTLMSK